MKLRKSVEIISRIVKTIRLPMLLLPLAALLSGCLSARPVDLQYANGVAVNSLTSSISLSYASTERSLSGSGYLMYRKPDQLRAVILSPFGSVLQEVYVSGEDITIVDAGNGIAFSGTTTDLPTAGDFSGWRHIHWLIDIDPPDTARGTSVIERTNRFGDMEKVTFENGLIISKTAAHGGKVSYGRYTALQGAAFPLEIIYETAAKETFTMRLDDPEGNSVFADGTFTPDLSKLRVYPISSLK